ncbi:dihydrodipicolinate synthase family protein [Nocardia rhamnosiphila]
MTFGPAGRRLWRGSTRRKNRLGEDHALENNLLQLAQCLDAHDDLEIMYGKDTQLFPAMLLGRRAAVGSTFNMIADVYRTGAQALFAGDVDAVREATRSARDLVETANRFGGPAAQKALYNMVTVDCGAARPPFPAISRAAETELRALVDRYPALSAHTASTS